MMWDRLRSNHRSREFGVGKDGGRESEKTCRRGVILCQSVLFQSKPIGTALRRGAEKVRVKAIWSEPVGGSEGFQEEKNNKRVGFAKARSRTPGRWEEVNGNLVKTSGVLRRKTNYQRP